MYLVPLFVYALVEANTMHSFARFVSQERLPWRLSHNTRSDEGGKIQTNPQTDSGAVAEAQLSEDPRAVGRAVNRKSPT